MIQPSNSSIETFEAEAYELGGGTTLRGISDASPLVNLRKVLFNIELRHDFSKAIQGILFFDAGNVYSSDIFLEDLRYSVGLGTRYFTPVGPLRLDFAYYNNQIQIHFGLGQLF